MIYLCSSARHQKPSGFHQASLEQIFSDFSAEDLFIDHLTDLRDAATRLKVTGYPKELIPLQLEAQVDQIKDTFANNPRERAIIHDACSAIINTAAGISMPKRKFH